ncbi:MAG: hypothetical protein O3A84_12325, partial [Proteobacteria bacterium]|nr:hypothetical protein [Pseudomonadota bacterium]
MLRSQLQALGSNESPSGGQGDVTGFLSILNEKPAQITAAFDRWVELTLEAPSRVAKGIDKFTGGR